MHRLNYNLRTYKVWDRHITEGEWVNYLQIPEARLFLAGTSVCSRCAVDQIWMFSRRADHLGPSYGFLQLHQPLLVLVPFHQHSRHFNASESLPLSHRYIVLHPTIIIFCKVPFHYQYFFCFVSCNILNWLKLTTCQLFSENIRSEIRFSSKITWLGPYVSHYLCIHVSITNWLVKQTANSSLNRTNKCTNQSLLSVLV